MASVAWNDQAQESEKNLPESNGLKYYTDKAGQKLFRVPENEIESFQGAAKSEGFEPVELPTDQVESLLYKYYSTNDGEKQFRVPVADVDTFLESAKSEGLSIVERRKASLDEYNKFIKSGYSKLTDTELHREIYRLESSLKSVYGELIAGGRQQILDKLTPLRQELARRDALYSSGDVVEAVAGGKSGLEAEEWVRKTIEGIQIAKEKQAAFERATSGDELGPIEKLKAEHKAKFGTEASTTEVVANAIVPFAKTIGDIFRNEQYKDLVKIAKGEFDIDEELRSNSTRLGYEATLYYNGVITKDELKESLMAKARGELGERAENRAIAETSIEKRGVSKWGNVASGGLQAVGMAGEFAVPGGVVGKLAVPAASAAAGAYSDLRTERYGIGEDGSLVQEKAADSAGTAAVKAVAFGATRVAVERFGGKLLGKAFGVTVGKGLSKIGSTKIATKIANSTLGQGVGYIVNFAKSPIKLIGWDGLPEEMGEEYLEGAINTAFGLDMTESEKGDTNPFSRLSDFTGDFFKTDNLQALAQSMLLMQAWGGGAAYLRKRYNSKQASQIILQTVDGYSEKQLNKLSLEKKCEIIAQHFKGLKKSQIESIIVNGASAVNELIKSLDAYNQVGLAKKREITSDMDAQLDAKIAEYASDENIARMIKEDITANLEDNAVFSDPEAFDEMVAVSARKFEPETMRLKVHDIRGTSMNESQKISEIENLGVTDWQSAEQAGLTEKDRFGRYTGGAVRALNEMFHGTTKLQEGVKAGTVSGNLAENLLTAATCELGGRSAAERGELIDGILDRSNGDEALANAMIRQLEADVDLNATVGEKLDRALTEAKAEVIKKRNPSASRDEVNGALVEPVEKPDGTITTTGEFVHGERGVNTERPMPSTPLEGVEEVARLKGAELTFAPEGELKCQSFPEMRVNVSADGVALNNLSGVNIADPARSAEFAAVVAQVVNIAKRNGLQIIVDEEHKPLIQALTSEIQSAGLAKTQAKLDTRSKLFSLLFKTTLGNGVTYDEKSFVEALERSSNGRRLVNNHGDIYGLVDADGVIHFNPAVMNFNTPIHEYGHLALDAVRKINPKLWEQGKKLIKDSDYYRSIVEQSNDPENPYSWAKGNDDAICDEALATMIGDRGEKLVNDKGLESKLKAWLKEVWKAFKGAFGLADLTDEQVEKMTLEEFVDTINAELLSGREFGTKKKLPPSEKSVKRYDEAEGSGSNGLLRWRNDRGYLFAIPVDMERTQPGGKVVFATDDANITDWIQSTLNGYDLRMSKSGKLYVKGRNGLPAELALIFGRFPTAGQNDGLSGEIANAVGNAKLAEASTEELVSALRSDRANYDAWVKAKSEGKSLYEARQEEHYADEAAREEAERKAHWENSGMGILDYIRSRMEDGDPEFDLDWEIAREMANDRAESRFSIGGFHGALATGKVGLLREADKMEKGGASREEIWHTTGWWRGKDGKWRVELPDIQMRSKREIELAVKYYGNSIRLDELVVAPELFKAYPALAETSIILDKDYFSSLTQASFDPSSKDITLNGKGQISLADLPFVDRDAYDTATRKVSSDDFLNNWIEFSRELGIKVGTFSEERKKAQAKIEEIEKRIVEKNRARLKSLDSDETRSILAHEIQHWIQENENFAKGGNVKTIREARALNKSLKEDIAKELNKAGYNKWLNRVSENVDTFLQTINEIREKHAGTIMPAERAFAETLDDEARTKVSQFLDKAEAIYNENAKEAHYGYTEEEAYRSLLGEVEARNVQRRLDMSPEERAATPPWKTESVPENRQIVRFSRARVITSENGDIFKVKSKEGIKKYKTPKEALTDFIKELDGVQMTDEQQGIYDVVTGVKNTTDIRKNDLGELVKLHKGGRGKGAKKILAVHYAGKRGRVTAKEVIDMGLTIRFGRLEYDGTADHPYSHTYTATTTDGVELKVVIDLDKKGNETIINFYSDRKTKNGGQRPHPVLTTASKEIVSQNAVDSQARFSRGGVLKRSGKDGKIVDVDQQRLTAVMRGLETGELKHPRFTREEFAASKGVRHERLWSYLLSLESPDIHAGGGQGLDGGKGGNDSQGSKGMGLVRRVATRYGSNPEEVIASRHKYFDKGVESKVYVTGGDTVIKVRKLNAYDLDGVKHELAKIVYHNYLFPNEAYTLRDIAVWNKNGYDQFYLIVEQPLVRPKTDANGNIIAPSEEAILKALNSAGRRFSQWDEAWNRRASDVDDDLYSSDDDFSSDDFVASGRKMAYNDEFVVYDFKPGRNTFIDAETGEIRFIDPRVDINDPGAGFSVSKFGKRKIDNRSMTFDGSPSNAGRARFHYVRGVDWSDITMDIFKFVPAGTLTAMGETEQSAAGLAGAIEKRGALRPWTKAESPADRAKPIAFDAADMVMFWRAVSGSLRNPHVQKGERIKWDPNAIGLNIGGDRIEIVSKLFGVIDESDIKKLREDCRAEGYFRYESADWCAVNNKGVIEDERLRSQAELDRRTRELYKTRVETGKGGEHYATQVLGHEIGHTLGLLPTGAKLGKVGDATRTLYEAFESELKRQTSGLGLKRGEDNLSNEINKLIAWWHGTETMPEYYAKPKEKFAELFGIFLTQPESVQAQAPKAYDLCVKLIAGNEKLTKAYQTITSLKWDGKSNDAVMAAVQKTWEKEAQDQYRKLVKLTKESISLKRDEFNYALNDRFGPMFAISTRALKAEKKLLDEAVRTGAMSEAEAADRYKAKQNEINALKTSLYDWQRQTGGQTRLMIAQFDDVKAQAEKDGVNWNDVRTYAHNMRVIELGGRATAHGVDPARASAILDEMRQKLGDEKYLKVEKTWKAYRAVYEKAVLDDPNVRELFDADTMKMLEANKHYVTMRHRMGAEETAEWLEKIKAYKDGNSNAWDPCIDVQERLNKGLGSTAGESSAFVLYHLVGSFEATEDPLAATIRRAIEIKESAARNHLLKQTSETLRALGAKGVFDKVAGSKATKVDPNVYGRLFYMDGGVKHELIVPKVIYKSFKAESQNAMPGFGAAMRAIRNTMTLWNPMFVNRAYLIDKSGLEANIKGLHKAPIDILSEALCFRGIGVPLYMINNYLARFTPICNTWIGKLLWNENTANHYAHKAQKIARIVYEGRFAERLEEARQLRALGETGRATEIEENVAIAQEMMRRNIFQSAYSFNKQQAGFDTDEIMRQFGYRIDGGKDPKTWKSRARNLGRWWTRFGEEQEAVTKIIAYLYELKKGTSAEEASRIAIERGGTPNLAARGVAASYIENATGFFWNVRKEATLRTLRAIKDHPTEWITKNFAQTAMPAFLKCMIITGGLEMIIRAMFDDDEEKIQNSWWAGEVVNYARFMNSAMKCVPGYYQRNYNIIPVAKFGDEVLSMRIKYSPEEFAIQNAIHTAFQKFGADPTDPDADWSSFNREMLSQITPDIFGGNYALDLSQILIGPIIGYNPYDRYRQRNVYDNSTWEARWSAPGNMVTKMVTNFANYSPFGSFVTRFKDGQEQKIEDSDVPAWLDAVLQTPLLSRIPASMLSITSSDSYLKALANVDGKQKAYARIVAGDLLAECIENGRLGGFEEGLKDLPPELKRLAIRHVLNGWRQFHMDPNAKKLRAMRRIKDPNLKRKARKWIEDAENFGD